MAEKIFTNVRLGLKVDTLSNWQSSSLVLKKGEIAFATVAASAGAGLSEPVVMMKIGDGEKTFSQLGFDFYAKASDVLAACKTEDGLKAFVKTVLTEQGVASDDVLQELAQRVTTAEGEIDALQADLNTAETGLKAKVAANAAAIAELDGLVGDKAVATQISEAIAALSTVYAAKSLETTVANHVADTVAHVTADDKVKWNNALQSADIAAGSANGTISVKGNDVAVKGLGSAAYTDSTAYDAAGSAADAEAAAKAYADGLAGNYDAKGAAATAEQNAKNYADGLAKNYDSAGSAATAEQNAKDYVDGQIDEWVGDTKVATQITNAITGLDLANTYAAKSHKHVKADITDFAHTHAISEVTGLQDALDGKQAAGDYATKAEAQGYANAKDAAIAAAKKAGDDAQADVDALAELVGTLPADAGVETVVAYVDKKTNGIATDAALGELQNAVDAIEADYLKVADKTALQDQIDDLDILVGDTAVATQISTAVATETSAREAADTALGNRVKAIEDDYLKAADKTELQNQITTNANAIERLTNGVSAEEVDGVNDLIQYVKDHGTEVTGMKADIKANADAIDAIEADYLKAADKTELSGLITGLDTRMGAAETAIGTKAAQSDLEALAGRVTTAEGKVTTLEGSMGDAQAAITAIQSKLSDKTVAEEISTAIDGLKNGELKTMQGEIDAVEGRADALEAKAHEHANKAVLDGIEAADVTAWDAKVDDVTAAADSGLKATRTGNTVAIEIDESVTFIFDCGTSA